MKYCKFCGKPITNKNCKLFCSRECYLKNRMDDRYKKYLKDNSICWGQRNMQHFKKYFLKEQDYKCSICGMKNEWNGKPITFVLDHIDGNADNNNRDNLRLICPNCDSQLDTYKSKNKNSARRKYRKT